MMCTPKTWAESSARRPGWTPICEPGGVAILLVMPSDRPPPRPLLNPFGGRRMTAATAPAPLTRDTLTAGTVLLTVEPDPHWRFARLMCGDEYHEGYTYRIERVADANGRTFTLFLHTLTANPRKPNDPGRFVYTGVVHPTLGTIRLTAKSAFPAHATRVKVAEHVLRALFTGRAADVAKANWKVTADVVAEAPDRF